MLYNEQEYYLRVSDIPFDGAIKISIDDYREIKHLFSNKEDIFKVKSDLVEKIQINETHASQISRIILSDDHCKDYFLKRESDIGVTLDELISHGNIFTPFRERSISDITIEKLYHLCFPTNPSTGKGEIFMTSLIKGCKKALVGDILINDKLYDVKGECARLGSNQNGFSGSVPASNYWYSFFKKYESMLDEEVPKGGTNSYSITKNRIPFQFLAAKKLLDFNIITLDTAIDTIKEGFTRVYTKLDRNKLKSVEEVIRDRVTDKAYENFLRKFPIEMLNYYLELENMIDTGLVVFNNKGKVVLIKYNDKDLHDKVNITYPSFASTAGSQGGIMGINVKRVRGEIF